LGFEAEVRATNDAPTAIGLLGGIDRIIHRTPNVGLALEAERRRGGSLFLREAVNLVVMTTSVILMFLRAVCVNGCRNGKRIAIALKAKTCKSGRDSETRWRTAARGHE